MKQIAALLVVFLTLPACAQLERAVSPETSPVMQAHPSTSAAVPATSVSTVPMPSPTPQVPQDENLCFQQVNPEQEQQLTGLISDAGEVAQPQSVCVIEPDGNGGYVQAHYIASDNFAKYLLYALLLQNSRNALFTYGVISGEISLLDYLTLSLMMGVDKYGSLFQPFTKSGRDGSWSRIKSDVGARVSAVRYGSTAPKLQTAATSPAPPAGKSYTPQPLPASKGSITQNGGTNAGERQRSSTSLRTSSGTAGSTKPKTGK